MVPMAAGRLAHSVWTAARNRQLCWPTGTGGRRSTASRRTVERSPSAPTTRSNSPPPPSLKVTCTGPSSRSKDRMARPSAPAHRHAGLRAGRRGTGRGRGPMAPHSSPRSISARRRPRWSSSRWRGISTAPGGHRWFQAQCLQGADAVRWQVNAGPGHLPAAGPLDHLGASPAWPSTLASARPPSPAPTTRICACFIPSPQWLTCPLSARVLAARTVFRCRARPGVLPAGCRLPVARVGRCRDAAPPGVARPAPRLG